MDWFSAVPKFIIKEHKSQEKLRISKVKNRELFEKQSKLFEEQNRNYIQKIDLRQKCFSKMGSVQIWLVDGDKVRSIDIDFTSGGHGYHYLYIPLNEIWIDNCIGPNEIQSTITHESIERILMRHGMSYNPAHDWAARWEMMFRSARHSDIYHRKCLLLYKYLHKFSSM